MAMTTPQRKEEINGLIDILTRPEVEELARIIENDFSDETPINYPSVEVIYSKVIKLVLNVDTIEEEITVLDDLEEYVKSKFY